VHYNWCYDPFQQNYVLSAENGWKLTIDNLPLYDTTLNPDGSLRKYRYYILESTSVGNDTLDRYTPVMNVLQAEVALFQQVFRFPLRGVDFLILHHDFKVDGPSGICRATTVRPSSSAKWSWRAT